MKKKISMIQKHCESGEILLKYEGEAQFEESGKGTVIRFCHRPASADVEIRAYLDAMFLTNRPETKSRLSFREGHETRAHLESEFGTISLQVRTRKYEKTQDRIYLHYAILDNGRVCDTFELKINVKEERDESD